jgi:hypothetical protein
MARPMKTMNGDGHYRCSKCRRWKPPEEFYVNRNMSTGLHSRCKECFTTYHQQHKHDNMTRTYLKSVVAMYPLASDEAQLKLADLLARLHYAEDEAEYLDISELVEIEHVFLQTGTRPRTVAEREAEEEATHQQMQAFIKAGGFTALAQRDAAEEIPRENPLTPQRDPETPVVRPDPPTRPASSFWDDGSDEEDEGRDGPYRFVPIGPPA